MKRIYLKPEMMAVKLQLCQLLAATNGVKRTAGNANLLYGGEGTGTTARTKESHDIWDEEW